MDRPAPHIRVSRRSLLGNGLLVGAGAVAGAASTGLASEAAGAVSAVEPFYGAHQRGISSGTQGHTILAGFDLTGAATRHDVIGMLKGWTALAAELAAGTTPRILDLGSSSAHTEGPDVAGPEPAEDSDEALGLGPQRLTLTFGFGRSLFLTGAGRDRFELGARLPPALIELPPFEGDELVAADSDGDLLVHACADDPQVAFHALRAISRAAPGIAALRWVQSGFSPPSTGGTPRNLLGFKDGTMDSTLHPPRDLDATLWVGSEGPSWMRGGTYVVFRRIRIKLESWDRVSQSDQEQIIGRRKVDGAPLGQPEEFSPLALGSLDAGGDWWIPPTSHVRMASPELNDGAVIIRRSFSYVNGTTRDGTTAGPPAAPGYDAGSLFLAYQKDPRSAFVPIYDKLALVDALRRFTTHTASAVFAVPPGASEPGDWVGRELFTQ